MKTSDMEWMKEAIGDGEAMSHIVDELKARLSPFTPILAQLLGEDPLTAMVLASCTSVVTETNHKADYFEAATSPVIAKIVAAAFMLGIATQLEDTNGS